jgi:hypothetical protein
MIMVLKVFVTSVDTEAETALAAVPRETKLTAAHAVAWMRDSGINERADLKA